MTLDDLDLIGEALKEERSVVHAYYGSEPGHPKRYLVEDAWKRWQEILHELELVANGQTNLVSL